MKFMINRLIFFSFFSALCLAFKMVGPPDQLFWEENFNSSSTRWKTANSAEEMYLIQGGDYIVHRKSNTGPSILLPNDGDLFLDSKLEMDLILDPKSKGSSLGAIFMATASGSSAYVFEINDMRDFRVRKIEGGAFLELSGTQRNGGWISNRAIKKPGELNKLVISFYEGLLRFSVNESEIWSTELSAIEQGKVGIYVGPASKGSIQAMRVFVTEAEALRIKQERENKDPILSELTGVIVALRNTINAQNKELDSLLAVNNRLQKEIEKYDNNPRNSRKLTERIAELENDNKRLVNQLANLNKQLDSLKRFQENIKARDGGDLLIKLSNALNEEQSKNANLVQENRTLNSKIADLERELKKYQNND